ncbi:hypothetical protein ACFU6I_16385 [Streptomyces sp. NPDC057486]|uniref:hypothetical protein n=1 Tax=Streptomyces sp. NPDC057486 TaxID=3346145 RepID=UPI0036D129DF
MWHGLAHGVGLVSVIAAASATLATAWLLTRPSGARARVSTAGGVPSAIAAWGMARCAYLVPVPLTVPDGAHTTLRRLALVTLVAVVFVTSAVALL